MKQVTKPWGYEKWITEEGSPYFLKEIFMKKGMRSSLQSHKKKDETNYILKGRLILEAGGIKEFWEGGYFHISPNVIHRVTAITDILMIEASTPEVDDVIRYADDTNRPSGRIESEHSIIGTDLNGNSLLKNPERYT